MRVNEDILYFGYQKTYLLLKNERKFNMNIDFALIRKLFR